MFHYEQYTYNKNHEEHSSMDKNVSLVKFEQNKDKKRQEIGCQKYKPLQLAFPSLHGVSNTSYMKRNLSTMSFNEESLQKDTQESSENVSRLNIMEKNRLKHTKSNTIQHIQRHSQNTGRRLRLDTLKFQRQKKSSKQQVEKVEISKRTLYHTNDGYFYKKLRKVGKQLYLVCNYSKCPVIGVTDANLMGPFTALSCEKHNHKTDKFKMSLAERLQKLKQLILHRYETEPMTLRKIYEEEICKFSAEVTDAFSFGTLLNMMNYSEPKKTVPIVNSLNHYAKLLKKPRFVEFAKTNDGYQFFHSKIENHTMLFVSAATKPLLQDSDVTFMISINRTSHATPSFLSTFHLVTILGICENREIAIIFALTKEKTSKFYIQLLNNIIWIEPKWNPQQILVDYDNDVRAGIKEVFPRCQIMGHWYHFSHNLRKKLHELHMTKLILEDNLLHKYVKMCISLPLLPAYLIKLGCEYIYRLIRSTTHFRQFIPFMQYIQEHWIKLIGPEQLSTNFSAHRINNYYEEYSGYLAKYLLNRSYRKASCTVLTFTKALLKVENLYSSIFKIIYNRIQGKKHHSEIRMNDIRIVNAINNFKNRTLSMETYLEAISFATMDISQCNVEKIEKKRKLCQETEELSTTERSDVSKNEIVQCEEIIIVDSYIENKIRECENTEQIKNHHTFDNRNISEIELRNVYTENKDISQHVHASDDKKNQLIKLDAEKNILEDYTNLPIEEYGNLFCNKENVLIGERLLENNVSITNANLFECGKLINNSENLLENILEEPLEENGVSLSEYASILDDREKYEKLHDYYDMCISGNISPEFGILNSRQYEKLGNSRTDENNTINYKEYSLSEQVVNSEDIFDEWKEFKSVDDDYLVGELSLKEFVLDHQDVAQREDNFLRNDNEVIASKNTFNDEKEEKYYRKTRMEQEDFNLTICKIPQSRHGILHFPKKGKLTSSIPDSKILPECATAVNQSCIFNGRDKISGESDKQIASNNSKHFQPEYATLESRAMEIEFIDDKEYPCTDKESCKTTEEGKYKYLALRNDENVPTFQKSQMKEIGNNYVSKHLEKNIICLDHSYANEKYDKDTRISHTSSSIKNGPSLDIEECRGIRTEDENDSEIVLIENIITLNEREQDYLTWINSDTTDVIPNHKKSSRKMGEQIGDINREIVSFNDNENLRNVKQPNQYMEIEVDGTENKLPEQNKRQVLDAIEKESKRDIHDNKYDVVVLDSFKYEEVGTKKNLKSQTDKDTILKFGKKISEDITETVIGESSSTDNSQKACDKIMPESDSTLQDYDLSEYLIMKPKIKKPMAKDRSVKIKPRMKKPTAENRPVKNRLILPKIEAPKENIIICIDDDTPCAGIIQEQMEMIPQQENCITQLEYHSNNNDNLTSKEITILNSGTNKQTVKKTDTPKNGENLNLSLNKNVTLSQPLGSQKSNQGVKKKLKVYIVVKSDKVEELQVLDHKKLEKENTFSSAINGSNIYLDIPSNACEEKQQCQGVEVSSKVKVTDIQEKNKKFHQLTEIKRQFVNNSCITDIEDINISRNLPDKNPGFSDLSTINELDICQNNSYIEQEPIVNGKYSQLFSDEAWITHCQPSKEQSMYERNETLEQNNIVIEGNDKNAASESNSLGLYEDRVPDSYCQVLENESVRKDSDTDILSAKDVMSDSYMTKEHKINRTVGNFGENECENLSFDGMAMSEPALYEGIENEFGNEDEFHDEDLVKDNEDLLDLKHQVTVDKIIENLSSDEEDGSNLYNSSNAVEYYKLTDNLQDGQNTTNKYENFVLINSSENEQLLENNQINNVAKTINDPFKFNSACYGLKDQVMDYQEIIDKSKQNLTLQTIEVLPPKNVVVLDLETTGNDVNKNQTFIQDFTNLPDTIIYNKEGQQLYEEIQKEQQNYAARISNILLRHLGNIHRETGSLDSQGIGDLVKEDPRNKTMDLLLGDTVIKDTRNKTMDHLFGDADEEGTRNKTMDHVFGDVVEEGMENKTVDHVFGNEAMSNLYTVHDEEFPEIQEFAQGNTVTNSHGNVISRNLGKKQVGQSFVSVDECLSFDTILNLYKDRKQEKRDHLCDDVVMSNSYTTEKPKFPEIQNFAKEYTISNGHDNVTSQNVGKAEQNLCQESQEIQSRASALTDANCLTFDSVLNLYNDNEHEIETLAEVVDDNEHSLFHDVVENLYKNKLQDDQEMEVDIYDEYLLDNVLELLSEGIEKGGDINTTGNHNKSLNVNIDSNPDTVWFKNAYISNLRDKNTVFSENDSAVKNKEVENDWKWTEEELECAFTMINSDNKLLLENVIGECNRETDQNYDCESEEDTEPFRGFVHESDDEDESYNNVNEAFNDENESFDDDSNTSTICGICLYNKCFLEQLPCGFICICDNCKIIKSDLKICPECSNPLSCHIEVYYGKSNNA